MAFEAGGFSGVDTNEALVLPEGYDELMIANAPEDMTVKAVGQCFCQVTTLADNTPLIILRDRWIGRDMTLLEGNELMRVARVAEESVISRLPSGSEAVVIGFSDFSNLTNFRAGNILEALTNERNLTAAMRRDHGIRVTELSGAIFDPSNYIISTVASIATKVYINQGRMTPAVALSAIAQRFHVKVEDLSKSPAIPSGLVYSGTRTNLQNRAVPATHTVTFSGLENSDATPEG